MNSSGDSAKKARTEESSAALTVAQRRQQFLDKLEREQREKAAAAAAAAPPATPAPLPPCLPAPAPPSSSLPFTPPPASSSAPPSASSSVPVSAASSAPPSAPPNPPPAVPLPSQSSPSPSAAPDPAPQQPAPSQPSPAAAPTTAPPSGAGIVRRLKKELADLERDPPPGCSAHPEAGDFYSWVATIAGPPGTPYEGGVFQLSLRFPPDYPFKPPKVLFLTKVYNQHVKDTGEICLDVLKESWSPSLNVSRLLVSIMSLLTDPNPDFALDLNIARQYKQDRAAYDRTVREWVQKYA